jgi:omega-amidase
VKPQDPITSARLAVALGEYDTAWHEPVRSLARAGAIAQESRAAGADVLVLPEICASGFTMDVDGFAEPPNGPSTRALSALAKDHQLLDHRGAFDAPQWTLRQFRSGVRAGWVTRRDLRQTAALRIREGNDRLFRRHDSLCDPVGRTVDRALRLLRLRFPELFRAVAPAVDACVINANWPSARQRHWEILTQARAIKNQCYIVAVNRIGEGGGLEYTGGSVICDAWGERCDKPAPNSSLRIAELSRSMVSSVREKLPLIEDSRRSHQAW